MNEPLIVTERVFNPKLLGKAVYIVGYDIDGEHYDRVFLVKDVKGTLISLINCQGSTIENLHIEHFIYGENSLKMTVLEVPK